MLKKATEDNRNEIMNYCLVEPSINLFIIGDIENFGFNSSFQEIWIQTKEEKITGIILRYHDNFIVYSKELDMDVNEILALLKTKEVNVISGKLSVIELIYPSVKDQYSKREMFFCELKDSSKLKLDTEEVEIAQFEDAMDIANVYGDIKEFKGMYSTDVQERYNQISNRIKTKEGIHMFIKEQGNIISHGNTTAETSVSGMIGGILTVSSHRNRGLASKVVSALGRSLIIRGKSACLFFDNVEAGRLYYNLGFEHIDKWAILGRK
ncbi:MAG: GNAT family N-acetyltransferase [Clostridium sp.]